MKTFKLKNIDYYVANVFSIEDAVFIALMNRVGITTNDLEETSIVVERDVVATFFRSKEELAPYVEKW